MPKFHISSSSTICPEKFLPKKQQIHPTQFPTIFTQIFLLLLIAISIVSNLPTANALGKRRMCGQVLTNELARICTKPGTRGPCVHGQFIPPAKRGGSGRFVPYGHQFASSKFAHQMMRFLQQKGEFHKRAAESQRKDGEEDSLGHQNFFHPFMHLLKRQPRMENSGFLHFDHRGKRAGGGIAQQCCSGNGCDDQFLDSFCCDEEEEKAFRAINS